LREAVSTAIGVARDGDAVLFSPAFPGVFSRHYTDSGGGYVALLRELARSETMAPSAGFPADPPMEVHPDG
jgi:hypothetical protein